MELVLLLSIRCIRYSNCSKVRLLAKDTIFKRHEIWERGINYILLIRSVLFFPIVKSLNA